jgi:hypothetical protein
MNMNRKLVKAAQEAMHDPNVEARPSWCSRFVRQVVEKAYQSKRFDNLFKDTAIHTGAAFLHEGFAKLAKDAGPLQPGDILVKMTGSGGNGHIGIYTGIGEGTHEGKVAENSSTSIGRISGAKGYRTLKQFGVFQLVARLPE